jgi:hypothetical protein
MGVFANLSNASLPTLRLNIDDKTRLIDERTIHQFAEAGVEKPISAAAIKRLHFAHSCHFVACSFDSLCISEFSSIPEANAPVLIRPHL